MIRLVKSCSHCNSHSIIDIDLDTKVVKSRLVGFGKCDPVHPDSPWVEYVADSMSTIDRLIASCTAAGYFVE
jgi:hypothetical protein